MFEEKNKKESLWILSLTLRDVVRVVHHDNFYVNFFTT